jgi:hypothetical protein
MRRIQLSSRALRITGASAALLVAAAVPTVANAATHAVPASVIVTCNPSHQSDGETWASGYCIRNDGGSIGYQEHVKCLNGRTYDGNVVSSRNGFPDSKATCLGANNFMTSHWITHT